MTKPVLFRGDWLTQYSLGQSHPMGPGRVEATFNLAEQLGLLGEFDLVDTPEPEMSQLALVHTPEYIAAVQSDLPAEEFGLGTDDNWLTPQLHERGSWVASATYHAAQLIGTGERSRAVNIAGGLHHAMPSTMSGFCVYNDVAIGIKELKRNGVERIVYLDVDAHHGDGVQKIFYDDPNVLTISLHESGMHLFPGTGFPYETGGLGAQGTAVNIALPTGVSDKQWLRAFQAIVPQVVHNFRPEVLVTQSGCDGHSADQQSYLRLSVDAMAKTYQMMSQLADEYTAGRWLATGGGGYAMPHVVPRAWSYLLAAVSRTELDPQLPIGDAWVPPFWRPYLPAGLTLADQVDISYADFDAGFDPSDRVDQAILATRRSVFPELGIDFEFMM